MHVKISSSLSRAGLLVGQSVELSCWHLLAAGMSHSVQGASRLFALQSQCWPRGCRAAIVSVSRRQVQGDKDYRR